MTRLTDERLADLAMSYSGRDDEKDHDLTLWDTADVYRMGYEALDVIPALVAELRTRRSQDLTAGDVEALSMLRRDFGGNRYPDYIKTALAVLDRLLKAGG